MKRLLFSLMLMILLTGCTRQIITSCPDFPLPSPYVRGEMARIGNEDPAIKSWGNRLLDLCEQLGTCKSDFHLEIWRRK